MHLQPFTWQFFALLGIGLSAVTLFIVYGWHMMLALAAMAVLRLPLMAAVAWAVYTLITPHGHRPAIVLAVASALMFDAVVKPFRPLAAPRPADRSSAFRKMSYAAPRSYATRRRDFRPSGQSGLGASPKP